MFCRIVRRVSPNLPYQVRTVQTFGKGMQRPIPAGGAGHSFLLLTASVKALASVKNCRNNDLSKRTQLDKLLFFAFSIHFSDKITVLPTTSRQKNRHGRAAPQINQHHHLGQAAAPVLKTIKLILYGRKRCQVMLIVQPC